MAGDWIKLEKATADKPEVWQMAEILGIEPDAVLGKLVRVWCWFDGQTEDGNVGSVTSETLSKRIDVTTNQQGFAAAMRSVGWLNGTSIPGFLRHFGKSEKKRALTYKRVKRHRNAETVLHLERQRTESLNHPSDGSTVVRGGGSSTSKSKPPISNEGTGEPVTAAVWSAYSLAYEARWGVAPVRNRKVNGVLKSFVERLGAAEAPDVARFYVRHPSALYVRGKHPVELMLRDAEGLRTEWATGRQVTGTEANLGERAAATGNAFGALLDEARARELAGPEGKP